MALFDDNYILSDEQFCANLQKQGYESKPNNSGVVLKCENDVLYTDVSDKHTLLFGSTGTKKTRNFCIPTVFSIGSSDESMLISDPKGEIYKRTSGFLFNEGYNIRVINFRDRHSSEYWNPLTIPYRYYKTGNEDKAMELLADLTCQLKGRIHSQKDAYWEEAASNLFFSIVLMIFEIASSENEVNFASVKKIREYISSPQKEEKEIFWDLVEEFKDNFFIKGRLDSIQSIKDVEKTLGCVLTTFDTMMQDVFINKSLLSMVSHMSFEYDELYKQKSAFFIIIPDEKTTFHFLASVFIKQLYEYLIDQSYITEGKLPIRVNYILDEFSNLPSIKDMSSMISAARSRNIRFFLIVQSLAQLEYQYKEEANTIKSNCSNWIFLPSRETALLKEISELCGEIFVEGRGYRPLFSISSLQCLLVDDEYSEALILRNNMRPYVSLVKDFSFYPQSKYDAHIQEINSMKPVKVVSVPQFMVDQLQNKIENKIEKNTNLLDDLF